MRQRIEQLSREKRELEALLSSKKGELRELEEMARKAKEARRIRPEETALEALLLRVFKKQTSAQVDPEEGITIRICINASAAPKINAILSPMTDNAVLIKNGVDYTGRNQYIDISFPFSQLESVKAGLMLSEGADLSADEPKFRAMC